MLLQNLVQIHADPGQHLVRRILVIRIGVLGMLHARRGRGRLFAKGRAQWRRLVRLFNRAVAQCPACTVIQQD
eukprot:16443020-Heterocapsa_arctica.AAC.1